MRYERVARLGRGGMGVVDLARAADGSEVALKRLTLHGSADGIAQARQRIRREAEVLTRLDHPNIVELIEVVDDGEDLTLVMAYLTGGTLADRVAKHGPAPAEEVERLADALGGALAEAHRAGVVHRDIKPGNVLFDRYGVPHLADFGVASSRDDTAGLTEVGMVVGTPAFMPPEQARGEGATQASDVFALGATLLYAATGEGPYGKGAGELLMVRAAQGKVRPVPRSVPAPLRGRLEAMLDPRPEKRPSAAAVVGGPAGTELRRPVLRRRRGWRPWAAVATVTLAGVVVGAVVATRDGGEADAAASTTSTSGCVDLPYQPCGAAAPAPGTDGTACLPGFEDYDGDPTNGCEAAEDDLSDPHPFPEGADPIEGTIVPRDDVDTFAMDVGDGAQLLCDGRFTVRLTAPVGMSLLLEVLEDDGEVLGQTTSANGVTGTVTLQEDQCLGDDARTLTARVSPIGTDRTGEPYVLERSGSF